MNMKAKLTVLLLVLAPSAIQAQTRTAMAIGAGPSLPIARLRDTQSQGVDLNFGLIRGSDESPFGLRLDLGYDHLPGKTTAGVKNAARNIMGGTVNVMFSAAGYTFRPYGIAGAGIMKMTGSGVTESKARFGFDFGVGINMPLTSKALFIETRINSISQHNAKPLRYVPVVIGFLF